MKFEWSREDRWMSNDGKGPMMARVVSATDKIVRLERWNSKNKNPRPIQFPLSRRFFTSERCGWKKVAQSSR